MNVSISSASFQVHGTGITEQTERAAEEQSDNSPTLKKAENEKDSDSVGISDEARATYIEDRIERLHQELKEVQESDLPEKEKMQRIQAITNELMTLHQELAKLKGRGGGSHVPGGTRAEGMGSSLT